MMVLLIAPGNRRDKCAMEDYFILNRVRFLYCLAEMTVYRTVKLRREVRAGVIDYY